MHPPALTTTATTTTTRSFLGLVMSCVELNMGWLQARIRKNFGFLFSFTGRTLFILL